jgi:hypothetical protein
MKVFKYQRVYMSTALSCDVLKLVFLVKRIVMCCLQHVFMCFITEPLNLF